MMIARFFILALLCLRFASPVVAQTGHATNMDSRFAGEILASINKHRHEMGLAPMESNPVIAQAAAGHSVQMATHKIPFGHDGFDARMASLAKKLHQVYGWAENVSAGASGADEVTSSWLGSKIHRENMEGNYNLAGIGISKDASGTIFVTAIFLRQEK